MKKNFIDFVVEPFLTEINSRIPKEFIAEKFVYENNVLIIVIECKKINYCWSALGVRKKQEVQMRNTLFLDLGTKTGFCFASEDVLKSGCHDFKKIKLTAHKYCAFNMWLKELIKERNIKHIVYEKVNRHVGTYAAHMYGAYEAIVLMNAVEFNLTIETLSVTEIKKKFTGNGRASKEEVIKAVNDYLGSNITDDNEADALAMYVVTKVYNKKQNIKIKGRK